MFGSSRSNSGDGEGTLAKVLRALRLACAAARPRSSASAAMSRKPGTRGGCAGGGVFSKLRRVGRSPRGGNCGSAIGTCGCEGGCGRAVGGGGTSARGARGRSPSGPRGGGGDGVRGRAGPGAGEVAGPESAGRADRKSVV